MNDRIREIKDKHADELLRKKNVAGVAIGYRKKDGASTGELALVVLVSKKVPVSELKARDVIPAEIEGVITDVQEVGDIRAQ